MSSVAITGGPADGKSTVCSFLREAGYFVISADAVVTAMYEEEGFAVSATDLVRKFGVSIQSFDREALRSLILENPQARRELNSLLHAGAMQRILSWVRSMAGETPVFAEVPLLIETVTMGCFDVVWVCEAGVEEQLHRLTIRLGSEAQAHSLLATQLPTRAKAAFADVLLRTNMPLDTVRCTVLRQAEQTFG